MTRYREIMRLSAMGQPPADVAAAAGCSPSTARRALKVASEAGLEWPLPEDLGDDAIKRLLYPKKFGKHGDFPDPDYEWVHEQLKRKGVTRTLLYEEYCDGRRAGGSRPCSVTALNNGYAEWAASRCPTMRIDRKPGQKMEADWAGTKMALADRDTGEPVDVYVFVARLPFSGKLYAEGFLGMDSECWLAAHVHARACATREGAAPDVFERIEAVCNRARIHSAPGYMSPAEFEEANWSDDEGHPRAA